jgi:hypothetical protein
LEIKRGVTAGGTVTGEINARKKMTGLTGGSHMSAKGREGAG